MASFVKKFFLGNQSWEFRFNAVTAPDGIKYHVTVYHASQLHHFTMNDGQGKWHMAQAPRPEQWIVELEEELGKAILDYESTK